MMIETQIAEKPPLRTGNGGIVYVADTRVTLDAVVGSYEDGATAEEIAQAYDVLALADIYAVIGYFLRHRSAVDKYLAVRRLDDEEARLKSEQMRPTVELRTRLLARRSSLYKTVLH